MALFEAQILNIRAVEAGNAAEMVTRLQAEIAAAATANEESMVDLELAGAGSGPQWIASFPTGSSEQVTSGASLALSPAPVVVAAVAGNPVELMLRLNQALAAASHGDVYKVVVAGGGSGPTYMAIALAAPSGG